MIIFDDYKLIDDIKKNGISANDKTSNEKLKKIMQYFLSETTYSDKSIITKIKKIASDYYRGLGDSFCESNLADIMNNVREKPIQIKKKKIITLYESEMQKIIGIKDANMQRIAFSALVCFKYLSQHEQDNEIRYFPSVQYCQADILRYADVANVSGTNRNVMIHKLIEMGLIHVFNHNNKRFKYNQTSWISMAKVTIPYCVDIMPDKSKEKKWMDMTNYEDIMMYLRLYNKDPNVTVCQNCGCPILREKAKRYCSDCASALKKQNDRARYQNAVAFA